MGAPYGNQFAIGNNGGQPPIYKNAEELKEGINAYFTEQPDKRNVIVGDSIIEAPIYTMTGLALFLGFASRQSLYDYAKRDEYSYLIKRAQTFIEREYEKKLQEASCTGAIFALKNMGWTDSKDITSGGEKINTSEMIVKIVDGKEK
jgi:hypothetical protein